jgi:putative transposase
MVSVPARRSQVAYAAAKGLPQRRACTLIGVGRSALHYRSTKAEADAPVLARMTALAAQYPRYGYRRIAIFLEREGFVMSFGRCHRLRKLAKLQVPCKRPRKRIATGRPRPNALRFNELRNDRIALRQRLREPRSSKSLCITEGC